MGTHIAEDSDGLFLVFLPLLIFFGGFMGTQRLWYQRAFAGDHITGKEAWSSAWQFVPRFVVFGFVTGLPMIPFWVLGLVSEWVQWASLVVSWILIDVWITFAVPALVYSTRRTSEALTIGWRLLRLHWQQVRWHALVPPLVIILGARTMPGLTEGAWVVSVISVTGWMANLYFKGAQARLYLDLRGSPLSP